MKIWIPGLESPGFFAEVLESPGIWTYRSIFFLTIAYRNSVITLLPKYVCIYCALRVREFIEKVLEFDIGQSWSLIRQNVYEP